MAEKILFDSVMNKILFNSGCLGFFNSNDNFIIADLDDPGSATRTITDGEISLSGNNRQINYTQTTKDNIITQIKLKYKLNNASGEYTAIKYCSRNSANDTHNFLTEGNEYQSRLDTGYEILGEDKELIVEADLIRDEATAEALTKIIIQYRYKQVPTLELTGTYSLLDIELGDKIDHSISDLPATYNSKIYMVVGMSIQPQVGSIPSVKIKLIDCVPANEEAAEVWQDTYATGDIVQDTYSTGDGIQNVYS
jgi:hypothetical protein